MFKMRLCVLLKSLMLVKAAIAILTKNHIVPDNPQDIPVPENNNHLILQNFQPDQNYFDSVTIRNEVDEVDEVTFANMFMNPESIGKIPSEPRAFVEFNGFLNEKINISVTFRWNQPEFANEVIQGYSVQCWFIENYEKIQICDDKTILTTMECTEYNLKPNTTYYFRVRAHTIAGAGPYTDSMNATTTHENPIPQLLIILNSTIAIWDLDSRTYANLFTFNSNVTEIEVAYSVAEHKIYWIQSIPNDEHVYIENLMIGDMIKNNITKITSLEKNVHNLCIDWIGRNLYWTENYESILKLDLTMWHNGIVKYDKILKRDFIISLTIQPSMGFLYFTEMLLAESYDKQFVKTKSDLNGKMVQIFLKPDICPSKMAIYYEFLNMKIDTINAEEQLVYWIDKHELIVANIKINKCNSISIAEIGTRFAPYFIIDNTNIYVIKENASSDTDLYILKKKYALLDSEKNASKHVQIIKTRDYFFPLIPMSKSLQPYPRKECLIPDEQIYNITIIKITANSIVLKFNTTESTRKHKCKNNVPTTKYIIYVSCLNNNLNNKFDEFYMQTYERHYKIQNLTPFTKYKLKLAVSNFYSDQLSIDLQFSSEEVLKTNVGKLNAPENVTVLVLTPTTAAVYWMLPTKLNCTTVTYRVYWETINSVNSTQPIEKPFINNKVDNKFFTIIQSLLPEQKYLVYVRVYPGNYTNLYNDSLSKTVYTYSEPNSITLSGVSINNMNISWIPSVNLTIHYILEYKNDAMQKWQFADKFETSNETVIYYIENLLPATLYKFRLILIYPEYENFTWPSDERFIFKTLGEDSIIRATQYNLTLMLSLVAIVIVICICYFIYCLYRQRKEDNEQVLTRILHDVLIGNVQLNALYSPALQYNPNKFMLTKIKREQITLTKLLGSGAFGMVYQGNVKDLEEPGSETSVAIKMLEKCASVEEKKKFLQEAKLMSRFRHEHVLRLLAVCLDEDSPLLVLELMETDLQKYLRECRILLQPSDLHALRLQDLLAMCEDVARGCCYLEELRFVHRDLACRNCLVSARDRENLIVKIGDFGLARDIYRNDYYRKEGEGLLPVRWMAPESLVNGIFTSQSDVWSFGVLMWEITSLGEQPYSTKSNLEVISYVREGGKLQMPLDCPSSLYQLMQRCWGVANARPNFKLCLNNIIALRSDTENAILNPTPQ